MKLRPNTALQSTSSSLASRHNTTPVVPNTRELKKLCRGNMIPIWNFLLERCKSEENIKKIQATLLLHGQQIEEEEERQEYENLKKQREDLKTELAATKANVQKNEFELEQLKRDMLHAERELKAVETDIKNIEVKRTILDSLSQKFEMISDLIDEYHRRLIKIMSSFASSRKQNSINKRGKGSNATEESSEAVVQSVRAAMTSIQSYLISFYTPAMPSSQSIVQHTNSIHAEAFDQAINSTIENLINDDSIAMGPEDLISALASIARADTEALRNETNRLSNSNDSTAKPTEQQGDSRAKAIQQSLEQEQKAHIQRYIDTIKCENQSRELEAQIKNHFELLSQDDEHSRALFELFESEVALASEEAAVVTLEERLRRLNEEREERMSAVQILEEKLKQIQDNEDQYKQRQELVHQLARQNAQLVVQLEQKQKEITEFVAKKIKPYSRSELSSLHETMMHSIEANQNAFSKISVSQIESAKNAGSILSSFNLKNLRMSDEEVETMANALQHLKFPYYHSPDSLIHHVIEVNQQIEDLVVSIKNHETLLNSRLEQANLPDPQTLAEIENQIKWIEGIENQQWIPALKETIDLAQRALDECQTVVPQVISDWKDQPAQNLVSWLTVDGLSLPQHVARVKETRKGKK
eukprot:TRINITY_DN9519_c0_g1_i1.p1 TRINITY_DN9519_c0_g1~~TRINITY_DN9519_c0_g1_i1.p1  ORF type:complete len:720 (-),score=162.36 TRINITY_DN9519_c0_g1_i1:42-1973(-)